MMKTAKRSDWQTTALPARRTSISLDRRFSSHEIQRIQSGLVPEQMEDKWFVYWENDTLFFHRSWTGICIYVVRFASEDDSYRMVKAVVNRDPGQYTEAEDGLDARMISYLIDVLLLKRDADFPVDGHHPQEKALVQWSQVGRAMLGEHPKDE